jgi:hypothetical protein
MEQQLARVVNKGLAGESEHAVLQVINTLEVFEFSEIKHVDEAGSVRDVTLSNNDLNQTEISHILNSLLHEVNITVDESKNVTLYF